MQPWDCCRTCLSTDNLEPIFTGVESIEKFADVVYLAVGIKIEPNDNLPQLVCTKCINSINDINKFKQNAQYAQKKLLERLENKEFYNIKAETLVLKTEKDFTQPHTLDDYHNDFDDDDIPLRCLQYNGKVEIKKIQEDTIAESNRITHNGESKKQKLKGKRPAKIKIRTKKENLEKDKSSDSKDGQKNEVECEYCHKILTSKLSLRNHYKIHTGFDFVCEHCGKKFITRRLLLMHCRAKHGYEKTDKCSYCDYKASNAEQVKIHERLHTGERPFVCRECGAGFHRKSSYLQHIAIHLPEKTVPCDQCPSRFKSVTLMKIHARRHRPPACRFRCAVCGNTFARRRNVARHLAAVHALPPANEHIQREKI